MLKLEGRIVRTVRVDVIFDHFHAMLSNRMLATGVPGAVAEAGATDLVQAQTFPVAGGTDRAIAGRAAELEHEGFFLEAGAAEEDGTELADMALIGADDLLPRADGGE